MDDDPLAKPKPQLTVLATKHTHTTGPEHRLIAYTRKSGLTPLTPIPQGMLLAPNAEFQVRLHNYKEEQCEGFKTSALAVMEAFAPLYEGWGVEGREQGGIEWEGLGRSIPINPIFDREKVA